MYTGMRFDLLFVRVLLTSRCALPLTPSKMALFTVFACGDVGEKINFELAFNGPPTLGEVHTRIVEAFVVALDHLERGTGRTTPFVVSMLSVYDVEGGTWHELVNASQLSDQSQLYVFQTGARDPPRTLPAPVLPPHALPPGSDVLARHVETPLTASSSTQQLGGISQPLSASHLATSTLEGRRAERLFHLIDETARGYILLSELKSTMQRHGLDTSEAAVGDTFSWGDHQIFPSEFRGFGETYPEIVDELLELWNSIPKRQSSMVQRAKPTDLGIRVDDKPTARSSRLQLTSQRQKDEETELARISLSSPRRLPSARLY